MKFLRVDETKWIEVTGSGRVAYIQGDPALDRAGQVERLPDGSIRFACCLVGLDGGQHLDVLCSPSVLIGRLEAEGSS